MNLTILIEENKISKKFIPTALLFFITLTISGCIVYPIKILLDNDTSQINYGYSNKRYTDVASCIQHFWQNRATVAPIGTIVYPTPLTRTDYPDFVRLSMEFLNDFEVSTRNEGSVIRHAMDDRAVVNFSHVAKGAIIHCSDSQKFTTLEDVNENKRIPARQ